MITESPSIDHIDGPNNLAIYHRGPDLSKGALPAVFYFALEGRQSLIQDPFCQPISFLEQSPIRCFSFTLPFHGEENEKKRAMHLWTEAFEQGSNFFETFLQQAVENIDYLINCNLVENYGLAACGLSRGGFVACHLAARHSALQTILAFAPMTQFGILTDYKNKIAPPIVPALSIEHLAEQLCMKTIRFYIGNRDQRVGTNACYCCIETLVETAYQNGQRAAPIELMITPSIGHKGHGTAPHIFHEGAKWLKMKLTPSKHP